MQAEGLRWSKMKSNPKGGFPWRRYISVSVSFVRHTGEKTGKTPWLIVFAVGKRLLSIRVVLPTLPLLWLTRDYQLRFTVRILIGPEHCSCNSHASAIRIQ